MNTEIKRTLIALSVAAAFALPATLVLGTGAAVAAPTATQLPGQGAFAKGSASSVTASNGAMTIKLNGNAVIDWGNGGTTINSGGTPGFNIGSQASVGFSGGSVLNIDQSGLPSQIYGHLSGSNSVFVANHSGIIVGPDAVITAGGVAGLIGNSLTGDTANFNGTTSSIAYGDTGGNVVSVAAGSKIHGTTVLIAGGNTVNVNLSGITSDNGISLRDGISSNGARSNGAASLTTSGNGTEAVLVRAAGNVTNSGNLTLAKSSTLAGALVNTGNLDSTAVGLNVASLNNSGNLDGADVNVGDVLKNAGTLSANSVTAGQVQDGNADPKPVSHMTVTGSLTSEHGISVYKNATLTVGGNLSSKVSGLSNYGGTISAGNVNVDDTLHNEGQFTANEISVHNANNAANGVSNSGNMTVYSIGTRGGLNNSGSINAGYSVSSTGDLANSGAIQAPHITAGTDIDNSGRLAGKSGAATAIITSGGAFTNESTGLVNAGTVVVGGDMTNLNKVDIGSVKVAGTLTNRAGNFHAGSVTSHYLENGSPGSTSPANMTVSGSLTSANIHNFSDGYLTVHGTIHGLSSLANYGHGTVSAGNVDLDDTLLNEGQFVANEVSVHNANNATNGVINSGNMSIYSIGTRGGLSNSGNINAGYSVSSTTTVTNTGHITAKHVTANGNPVTGPGITITP